MPEMPSFLEAVVLPTLGIALVVGALFGLLAWLNPGPKPCPTGEYAVESRDGYICVAGRKQ